MNRNEPVKHQVLTILRDCNGNVSFETLMESCGLSFVELSSMLGLLFKEKRIGVYVPQYVEGTNSRMPRKEELFKRFIELLSVHYLRERRVAFYASKLCVCTKYLTSVVQMASGKSPAAWINEKVIGEIKHRLSHSQASIKEIAYALNFNDVSFFGKYFRQRTGVTPAQYRNIATI